MVTNLEILSKEMIKPSSPTPHHLRNLQLSLLDQIVPSAYIPLIFFYNANQLQSSNKDHPKIAQILKQSLSNVLTQFYPLAGGLTSEISSVDCNDSGALFVEAQVHTTLSEVTEKPIMEELKQFVPLESNSRNAMDKPKTVVLAVQITFFDCGGIAVGVQISHKIADGTSLVTFLNSWAASCRGDDEHMLPPAFEWAKLFPPIDMSCFGFKPPTAKTKEKIVTERFV
nr:vinorine synthase-like [Coffea arabica]